MRVSVSCLAALGRNCHSYLGVYVYSGARGVFAPFGYCRDVFSEMVDDCIKL